MPRAVAFYFVLLDKGTHSLDKTIWIFFFLNSLHMPACGLSVFSARMHYLIAPYLLGNHFQTRVRGFWREGGRGNPSLCELRGFFLHEGVWRCGKWSQCTWRGAKDGRRRRGDGGMRGGPSNTLIKTQSHIQALSSSSKGCGAQRGCWYTRHKSCHSQQFVMLDQRYNM